MIGISSLKLAGLMILVLTAFSSHLGVDFCGGDFNPCPVEQGPELERMGDGLKAVLREVRQQK